MSKQYIVAAVKATAASVFLQVVGIRVPIVGVSNRNMLDTHGAFCAHMALHNGPLDFYPLFLSKPMLFIKVVYFLHHTTRPSTQSAALDMARCFPIRSLGCSDHNWWFKANLAALRGSLGSFIFQFLVQLINLGFNLSETCSLVAFAPAVKANGSKRLQSRIEHSTNLIAVFCTGVLPKTSCFEMLTGPQTPRNHQRNKPVQQ